MPPSPHPPKRASCPPLLPRKEDLSKKLDRAWAACEAAEWAPLWPLRTLPQALPLGVLRQTGQPRPPLLVQLPQPDPPSPEKEVMGPQWASPRLHPRRGRRRQTTYSSPRWRGEAQAMDKGRPKPWTRAPATHRDGRGSQRGTLLPKERKQFQEQGPGPDVVLRNLM